MVSEMKEHARQEIYHYYGIGRYEKVEVLAKKLLASDPSDIESLNILAETLFQLDRYDEAVETCRQALALGLNPAEGNELLGRIYLAMEAYAQSEECFLAALSENPEQASTLAAYGYLMLTTGHEDKATKLMEEALRLDSENPEILHYNFHFNLARGDKYLQLENLQQYMVVSSNEVRKLVNLGLFELHRNNYRQAREHLREAYLLDPTNEPILELLKAVEKDDHWLFWPHRLGERIGNPAIIWIGAIAIIVVLRWLGYEGVAGILSVGYFLWAVSTWITPALYKIFVRR